MSERGEEGKKKSYFNVVGIIAGAELTDMIEAEVEKQIEKCLIGFVRRELQRIVCLYRRLFFMFILF